MELISKQRADKIRYSAHYVEYGDRKSIIGTGRATCRCCGLTIAKGEAAYKFAHDFHGGGSNTATVVQIHADNCA